MSCWRNSGAYAVLYLLISDSLGLNHKVSVKSGQLHISLALARRKADAARHLVAESSDPCQKRKAEKTGYEQARVADDREAQGLPPPDSFEAMAREWFSVKRGGWAPSYADMIIARLDADMFSYLGRAPIIAITPPQLLEVLRRIESPRVVETAHRALENCDQVFRYAVATGKHSTNPARD